MKTNETSVTQPGTFVIGCNYWASHAGTAMWSEWRPEVVDADLQQLAEAGLQVLRVFPLWPDFQPLAQLYGGGGSPHEIRLGEEPLGDDEAGQAGLSEAAMARFAAFADMAKRHGLRLVVGLLTGWMSGRLFVPPALEGHNVLTDPIAIMWEVRFVRCFVRRFKDHAAIWAWDLGNECNVMGPVPSHEAAWAWTAAIANTIHAEDGSRPVFSGMHGLDEGPEWTIRDQAELTDVLTTHPYPYFTPHCDQDPLNTMRSELHATAQSRWYADVGGKPCLAEEAGTLGPMFAGEQIAADYARATLFSLWAHDCRGLLWWCAYDQGHLVHTPYDWTSIERELGLFRADRSAKPVAGALGRFGRFVRDLPSGTLPPRITDAVCILTHGQDRWGAAYGCFVMARQAGFDVVYQYDDQPLKDAEFYLMPGVSGSSSFSRRTWTALLERVRAGATLYLSHDDCILWGFKETFGLEVQTRERRTADAEIVIDALPGAPVFSARSSIKLRLEPASAEILGREADGNPAFSHARYGKGGVYFLSVPVEQMLSNTPGGFHAPTAQPWWQVYRQMAQPALDRRIVTREQPWLGITEHPVDPEHRIVVAINYDPQPLDATLRLAGGWRAGEAWYGPLPRPDGAQWRCQIGANDAAVFTVSKAA